MCTILNFLGGSSMATDTKQKSTPVPPKAVAKFLSSSKQLKSRLATAEATVRSRKALKSREVAVLRRQIEKLLHDMPASW
jgi:hypothetical protein